MTEILEGSGEVLNPQPVQNSPAPAAPSSEGSEGRLFKQSEVNDIVKRAKNDAVDTYRRLSVEQPEYLQKKYGDVASQAFHGTTSSPVSVQQGPLTQDDVKRMAAEEFQPHGMSTGIVSNGRLRKRKPKGLPRSSSQSSLQERKSTPILTASSVMLSLAGSPKQYRLQHGLWITRLM